MQFPQCKNQRTLKFRRISTIRLQDLKYSPGNCMRNCKAPSDWRVPEGPDAAPVGGGGAWPGLETAHHRTALQAPPVWRAPEGAAAVPVGGGGAWPGFETTRRAKLAARTARGRAAAHRHIQRAGHAAAGDLAGPQAPPNGEASELLVVLRVLVGLAAVGAAKRTDRRHLL